MNVHHRFVPRHAESLADVTVGIVRIRSNSDRLLTQLYLEDRDSCLPQQSPVTDAARAGRPLRTGDRSWTPTPR